MTLVLALLLVGCDKTVAECSEEIACGFGETCVEGTCRGQSCATSAQCEMEQFCDGDGECRTGCEDDQDCYPGDVCSVTDKVCVTESCSDTRQDCAFEQFCDLYTGECYDAGGYYCAVCQDDGDCGGNGNICLGFGGTANDYCGVTCTTENDCPNGYTCAGVSDVSGNIVAYQCITYCWLYEESARMTGPAAAALATPADESLLVQYLRSRP